MQITFCSRKECSEFASYQMLSCRPEEKLENHEVRCWVGSGSNSCMRTQESGLDTLVGDTKFTSAMDNNHLEMQSKPYLRCSNVQSYNIQGLSCRVSSSMGPERLFVALSPT